MAYRTPPDATRTTAPALQTALLCATTIDTDVHCTRFLIDNWLLIELRAPSSSSKSSKSSKSASKSRSKRSADGSDEEGGGDRVEEDESAEGGGDSRSYGGSSGKASKAGRDVLARGGEFSS